jgi:hypothetical protein
MMMTDSPTFDVETALAATTAPRVTADRIQAVIAGQTFARLTGTLTVCVLTLENGFTVTGESACASPENYDQDIGEHYARKDAERKIWPLEGYLLRQQLHDATMPEIENLDATEQPGPYVGLPPHMQRVAVERDELADRLGKLTAFIAGDTFQALVEEAQFDLVDQQSHMCAYLYRLNHRLDRYPRLAS